jgi:hypothetical protein
VLQIGVTLGLGLDCCGSGRERVGTHLVINYDLEGRVVRSRITLFLRYFRVACLECFDWFALSRRSTNFGNRGVPRIAGAWMVVSILVGIYRQIFGYQRGVNLSSKEPCGFIKTDQAKGRGLPSRPGALWYAPSRGRCMAAPNTSLIRPAHTVLPGSGFDETTRSPIILIE